MRRRIRIVNMILIIFRITIYCGQCADANGRQSDQYLVNEQPMRSHIFNPKSLYITSSNMWPVLIDSRIYDLGLCCLLKLVHFPS